MENKKNTAIVLVSGGMDSCITAGIAQSDGFKLAFLHVNYGQRTEKRELESFNMIKKHYKVKQNLIVDITHLSQIGASCLTDMNINVPIADLNNSQIPISYVPFRNANILSIATSWAEVIKANYIYVGAVEEDSSGYPDCRRQFFDTFEELINQGTRPNTKIKILTPLISLSKKEIVKKGFKINAPLNLTWSCYEKNNYPCQKCDSCALRERGFKEAEYKDPLFK